MARKKYKVGEGGMMPLITDDIKITYSGGDINSNLLLNKILGTRNKQITKVTDDEISKFLLILSQSKLQMPDGTDSLEWLKKRIRKRFEQSQSMRGQTWENICRRYQFILEQIDVILATRM